MQTGITVPYNSKIVTSGLSLSLSLSPLYGCYNHICAIYQAEHVAFNWITRRMWGSHFEWDNNLQFLVVCGCSAAATTATTTRTRGRTLRYQVLSAKTEGGKTLIDADVIGRQARQVEHLITESGCNQTETRSDYLPAYVMYLLRESD